MIDMGDETYLFFKPVCQGSLKIFMFILTVARLSYCNQYRNLFYINEIQWTSDKHLRIWINWIILNCSWTLEVLLVMIVVWEC